MATIIHDVVVDNYGQRVATCSSDQTIRVFDSASGAKLAEWRGHGGSIWRLSWAPPEFGVVLASCSFDRKVCVWEENTDTEASHLPSQAASTADATALQAQAQGGAGGGKVASWPRVAEIGGALDSVSDVQFAPHSHSVRIASCGGDGFVRIHEAPDVLDLSSWELHAEFDAGAAATESVAEAMRTMSAASALQMHGGSGAGAGVAGDGGLGLSGGAVGHDGGGVGAGGGGASGAYEPRGPLCLSAIGGGVGGSMSGEGGGAAASGGAGSGGGLAGAADGSAGRQECGGTPLPVVGVPQRHGAAARCGHVRWHRPALVAAVRRGELVAHAGTRQDGHWPLPLRRRARRELRARHRPLRCAARYRLARPSGEGVVPRSNGGDVGVAAAGMTEEWGEWWRRRGG